MAVGEGGCRVPVSLVVLMLSLELDDEISLGKFDVMHNASVLLVLPRLETDT